MDNTNLVIVAGGKGKRFKHLNVFPKILLPTQKNGSILLEYIQNLSGTTIITIIINEQYYDELKNYCDVNRLNGRVKIVRSKDTQNSAETIITHLKEIPSSNVLLLWCDIIVDNIQGLIDFCGVQQQNTVFVHKDGNYRYVIENDKIIATSDYSGNIPGIYFIKNMDIFLGIDYRNMDDFINCLQKVKNIQYFSIDDIGIDIQEYRDIDEYRKIIKIGKQQHGNTTRFFNSMTDNHDGTLTKTVIDDSYKNLMTMEQTWYKKIYSLGGYDIIPQITEYYDNGFRMQYLSEYITLRNMLDILERNDDYETIHRLYHNIYRTIEKLTLLDKIDVPFVQFEKDLHMEIVEKVISRCDKIKHMLITYNQKFLSTILEFVFQSLKRYVTESHGNKSVMYHFCHGDLNGSNVMVNPKTLEIKFIDPRGYFGHTQLYGWKPYEYSKILYCMMGYDDFNTTPQIYAEDKPKDRTCIRFSGFQEKIGIDNFKYYDMMVGVIYVALAGYISQDIMKANIAYEHGIKKLEKYFN